jgi:hypothetical protein
MPSPGGLWRRTNGVADLRAREEWRHVEREVDVRLRRVVQRLSD